MELGVQVAGGKSTEDNEARLLQFYRQPPPLHKNILESLRSKYVSSSFGFPVTLEFRGNAAVEILAKDGWTPTHSAAGRVVDMRSGGSGTGPDVQRHRRMHTSTLGSYRAADETAFQPPALERGALWFEAPRVLGEEDR
eukprot:g9103.t1